MLVLGHHGLKITNQAVVWAVGVDWDLSLEINYLKGQRFFGSGVILNIMAMR